MHSRIVQNVSGRTLVGLRFWNQARPFYFELSCCSNLSSGWRRWWELLGVWKSWCKVTHYTNIALLIIISLPDQQTLWIQGIFFSVPLLHVITNISSIECFGYDHHRSTGSFLIFSLSRLRSTCSLFYGQHSWLYRSWNLVLRLFNQFPLFNKHWSTFPASFPLSYLLWCSTWQMLLVSLMRKIVGRDNFYLF